MIKHRHIRLALHLELNPDRIAGPPGIWPGEETPAFSAVRPGAQRAAQ